MKRSLSLRREVLVELTGEDLRSVAGGGQTEYSCLDYISCAWIQCVPRWALEQVERLIDPRTITTG